MLQSKFLGAKNVGQVFGLNGTSLASINVTPYRLKHKAHNEENPLINDISVMSKYPKKR
ncbi:MAG: hypothetical protein MRJ93_14040 [Nitrososphaeraceae archaeon]|nr:hypothetical protein [Nitrososphaeraceae archaeon]